jgi:hypothetical protein
MAFKNISNFRHIITIITGVMLSFWVSNLTVGKMIMGLIQWDSSQVFMFKSLVFGCNSTDDARDEHKIGFTNYR